MEKINTPITLPGFHDKFKGIAYFPADDSFTVYYEPSTKIGICITQETPYTIQHYANQEIRLEQGKGFESLRDPDDASLEEIMAETERIYANRTPEEIEEDRKKFIPKAKQIVDQIMKEKENKTTRIGFLEHQIQVPLDCNYVVEYDGTFNNFTIHHTRFDKNCPGPLTKDYIKLTDIGQEIMYNEIEHKADFPKNIYRH